MLHAAEIGPQMIGGVTGVDAEKGGTSAHTESVRLFLTKA
jgi:hypothetical protein